MIPGQTSEVPVRGPRQIIANALLRYPLLPIALCFTLGIVAAYAGKAPLSWMAAVAVTVGFAAIALRRRWWILWPVLVLAGATHFTLRTAIIHSNDLRNILGTEPREAIIRGTIADTPYQRVFNRNGTEQWRTLARVQVDAIALSDPADRSVRATDEKLVSATGEVIVGTPEVLAETFYKGQRVQIEGVIRQPAMAVAPGLFDYRKHLGRQGVHYQLIVESTNDWRVLNAGPVSYGHGSHSDLPLSARFSPWARGMLAKGLSQDRYVELLWAMTLGWKTGLSGEVSEPFMRSGTMHVFAISGLHIALIALILVAALRVLGFRRRTCAFIVIPLIWAYTGATGWQASAIRSTIMSSVIIAGWFLRRPSNLLNSLMAAAFLILLWDPLQLFQAGFQLSFFVVLALALLTPALDRLRTRMLAPDPFLAPQFRTRVWRWWNWGAHTVIASAAVSLAAWLGSLPLIANYFHLLTPVTLLANMVVVPLSSGALACNLATLTIGIICPPAAELFNHCAWLLMVLMVKVSEWAAAIPLVVLHVKAPSVSTIILYYTLLIAVFSGWLFREGLRRWAGGAAAVAVIPLALQVFQSESAPQMAVLPLQGGSAVYVNHKGRSLIDCGRSDDGRLITKPFLQSQGINRLEHLILTHGDVRHVEAAPLIYETFSKPAVYMSPLRFRSPAYKTMQAYFETNRIPTKSIVAGDRIGMWELLHPDEDTNFPQADDKAIVLFGEISGHRILLLSDLGIAGQNALLTRHPDLRADIVVTGLPNQGEPVADGFLDIVQPKLIVIADAEQERAKDRLRERLEKRGIEVLYTSDSGAVTFTFSGGGRLRRDSMKGSVRM